MKKLLVFLLLCCPIVSIGAIDDATDLPPVDTQRYPTYAAIINTDLPATHPADLAQRFYGIREIPAPLTTAITRQIGDRDSFFLVSTQNDSDTIEAILQSIGEHVYIWVDDQLTPNQDHLATLTQRFDTEVYEFVRSLWGSEASPGIDGETRIHIIISGQVVPQIAGYFSPVNNYSAVIAPNSNERDMLVMNQFILDPENMDFGISVAVHEFQHMIQLNLDASEEQWFFEGIATLTQQLHNPAINLGFFQSFAALPQVQLTNFDTSSNAGASYGASSAFMLYLYDRYGLEFMQELALHPANGLPAIDRVLASRNQPPIDIVFADWVLANILREDGTRYGYQTLPMINPMALTGIYSDYPLNITETTAQYGTRYYRLNTPPQTLNLSLQTNDFVPLISSNPPDGNHVLYSQRGDSSNPRLTRTFDLTDVASAQLDYLIWYDLEDNWDYGYITISKDGGTTWEMLTTPAMTDSDRHGRAYGIGYTGQSAGWLAETLILDEYAGHEILIRFEIVHDAGTNQQGMALDDIRLEAIDYHTSFETDADGWRLDGWIRTDNRLPQRYWVQLIEHYPAGTSITRHFAQSDTTWAHNLDAQTQFVTLAVSPFAPMTTQPATYTLQVE